MKIKPFQLYVILTLLSVPLAFLEVPRHAVSLLQQNGWLAVLGAIIPCTLFALMYLYIIKKSRSPFPLLLEEHLGSWLGRLLGFLYIPMFLLTAAINTRFFVDFIETHVLPGTPISVLVGILLLVGFVAIRGEFTAMVRGFEIILFIGMFFTFFVLAAGLLQNTHITYLYPIAYMNISKFLLASLIISAIFARIMPVLSFAFFLDSKKAVSSVLAWSVTTYILIVFLSTLVTILTLGGLNATLQTFPAFVMVTLIHLGRFVQNIDILFIGVWIMGIYASLSLFWFMGLYTSQQVFRLSDYRYLAAPSSLIIGIAAIQFADNIIELFLAKLIFIALVYGIFFIIIPFLIFLITLFKSPVDNSFTVAEIAEKAE